MHCKDQRHLITSFEDWKKEYKKDKTKTWIIITLDNNVTYYFEDFDSWYDVMEICKNDNLKVLEVGLRFRSNVKRIPIIGDGVYLIRSAIGSPGSETIYTMTIGDVFGNDVEKTVVHLPALTQVNTYVDNISECSKEVLLLW